MPSAIHEYQEVLDEHKALLDRLVTRRGAAAMKSIYEDAAKDLIAKLAALPRSKRSTFTAHLYRQMLAQLQQGRFIISRRLFGEMGDLSKEAQVEAVRGLSRMLNRLEGKFTGVRAVLPIEEAARFRGIIDSRRTSLLAQHRTSIVRYTMDTIRDMEMELAKAAATNQTGFEVIERLEQVAMAPAWRLAMVARTEMAWAFNSSHVDGVKAATEVLPDLKIVWSEHVDPVTLEPYDERVAIDSIAMQGQVAAPGEMFTMPATAPRGTLKAPDKLDVPPSLVGGQWESPPCRPNGREVVAPWRAVWGIPGWQYVNGQREFLRAA